MRGLRFQICLVTILVLAGIGFGAGGAIASDGEVTVTIAEQALHEWLDRFGENAYRVDRDERRRIIYATSRQGLSENAHREMRAMLDELADHLSETLFGDSPDYEVLVAIASPRDARRLFQQHNVGGSYVHRTRQLVSRDTGGSLRHEFFHVMHYGHMERLGQPHALWVQEGLASLYEDYELTGQKIRFLPNDRNEITRNRARINRLVPWQNVFELPAERFMARATVLYPQARSMFEFVAAEGKLHDWYAAYVEHFDADRTGQMAFEHAFDMEIREIERQWREWVGRQPRVEASQGIEPGRPSLGIGTSPAALMAGYGDVGQAGGANDGVLVTQVLPGSTASAGDVRVGDIVVAIDGRATHTMTDLRRAIEGKEVGEEVTIRVRRGEHYATIRVQLRALNSR